MSEIKRHVVQAWRFEFGRVHHYRNAEALYERADASDDCAAVALGRLCVENGQFGLIKRRTDTLVRLRRAAATSVPSFLRKLAIYAAYLNGRWNRESTNLIYVAFQKGDYQAGFVMSMLLELSGDVVMKNLSLSVSDRRTLYLDCLQRSARFGCLEASCVLSCYYWDVGRMEEAMQLLTWAAEAGYFVAFERLVQRCRYIGSDAYYVDLEPLLCHAKRLACDMNEISTAGSLADYLADDERGALMDRIATLRFDRKSFRRYLSEHTYVIFGDRRWERKDTGFVGWLPVLRNDYLVDSKFSHFPIVRTSGSL